MFATADQSTKALAQPDLRFPAEVLNGFRQRVDPGLNVLGHFRGMAIRPGAFDQCAPGATVAGLRDAALASTRPAGVLRRNEADEGPELAGGVEACEVTEFGDDGERDEPLHAAERLQGLHDG